MIQIDVKRIENNNVAVCNMYTDNRCVRILMSKQDYECLVRDGFFIRDGKSLDSADMMNTTAVYEFSKKNVPKNVKM